jgi:hypothetical protein
MARLLFYRFGAAGDLWIGLAACAASSVKAIAREAQAGLAKRLGDDSGTANWAHRVGENGFNPLKLRMLNFPIATASDSH